MNLDIAPGGVEEEKLVFPKQGDEYDLWVVVVPDCDERPQILEPFTDRVLETAMTEFGGSACEVEEIYFGDTSDKLNRPGLWKVRVRVGYQTWSDWESGHKETNLILEIIKAERVE